MSDASDGVVDGVCLAPFTKKAYEKKLDEGDGGRQLILNQ